MGAFTVKRIHTSVYMSRIKKDEDISVKSDWCHNLAKCGRVQKQYHPSVSALSIGY